MSVRTRSFVAAAGVAAGLLLVLISAFIPGLAHLLWPGLGVAALSAVLVLRAFRDVVGEIDRNQASFEAALRREAGEKREQKK